MGAERKMQPLLFHVPNNSDVVFTPEKLADDVVQFFKPSYLCLDPCAGNNVFYNRLPAGRTDWCEISRGRDFYSYTQHVNWIVSNPPFSHYSAWMRHSMEIADNIVYLLPVYKIFASDKFQRDLFSWGGIVHNRHYGTGTDWGFPFGHSLSAVHFQRGYFGPMYTSFYEGDK